MWLGDGEGEGGGLRNAVGLVVDREGGGLRAVGGVCGDDVSLGDGSFAGAVGGSGLGGAGLAVRWGGLGGLGGLGRGAGAACLVVGVGDAELGGVLVLAGGVVDQLDAVALSALGWSEVLGRSPDVGTIVLGLLDDRVLWDGVGAGALEKDESDGALGGRVPGDGEALADWDDRVETWLRDWVALRAKSVAVSIAQIQSSYLWRITLWLGVGGGEGRQAGKARGEEAEHGEIRHFGDLCVVCSEF